MELTPEAEQYIETLEILSKSFDFYELESRKLDKEAAALEAKVDDESFAHEIDKINRKMDELFVRYQKDRQIYLDTIAQVKNYFFNKYGVVLDLEEYK